MALGPFQVTAEDIARLDAAFTDAINRLLETEAAAAGMLASSLVLNRVETIADGGVDASIHDAPPGTDWIPEGNSAWQFKRSNLGPTACADEFAKSKWAHDYLKSGGSYVVVLGVPLSEKLIEDRRRKIVDKAVELGLLADPESARVLVYDANALARWVSLFPSLAVNPVMGGPGTAAVDFTRWSASRRHQLAWTPDDARTEMIAAMRSDIVAEGVVEVRVQGEPGVGKTRLVLEALRVSSLEPLVAYVADAAEVSGELLEHLIGGGRTAVLVIDECPAERHASLAARLPDDPRIKLITIGHLGAAAARRPVLLIEPLPRGALEKLLEDNFSQLSSEARRFVVDHANGNPRWAEVMALRVLDAPDPQAAELIARNDIDQFVSSMLPEGRSFFIATGIALFERVGWDREVATERELLADFLAVSTAEIQSAASELDGLGLLTKQGRFRSVSPHPLAVFLASRAWERDGQRIVEDLLNKLDEGMALSLFRRLADLGRFGPAQGVVAGLLGRGGLFESLQTIEERGTGRLLTQLAIVLPREVSRHLSELVEGAAESELRELTGVRRDLVWTLEKLAWHSDTFEAAADSLLALAMAENETYGNNATGTWKSMFGTMLPATAASPALRIQYLARAARHADPRRRLLAVDALAKAIDVRHESTMVSGELQGGVLVEPRGRPETWGEAWDYQVAAIDELAMLADDDDDEVRSAARAQLVGAIHPLAGLGKVWDKLEETLLTLPVLHPATRRELVSLQALYERRSPLDDTEEKKAERQVTAQALESLHGRLPEPRPDELLELALSQRRWDLEDGELQARVLAAMTDYCSERDPLEMLQLLGRDMPAAWEFGVGLASLDLDTDAALRALADAYEINPPAMRGYLLRRVEAGETDVIAAFLESPHASRLSDAERLEVALLVEPNERLRQLIDRLVVDLPTAAVVRRFPRPGDDSELSRQLEGWCSRLKDQADYNAVVDWFSFALHGREELPELLRDTATELVLRRRDFPDVGRESWDWGRIAGAALPGNELAFAELVLDLMEHHELITLGGEEESQVLRAALERQTEPVWSEIADRLEAGSWRISMSVRPWLLSGLDPGPVEHWIGEDTERARIVARIAPVGGEQPTPIARHLLDKFGDDAEVGSSLYGALVSGSWVGNESDRIQRQIDQLNSWRDDKSERRGVRRWAADVVQSLMVSRQAALEREAERDF